MFWLVLLMFIATTVIGALLAPKQQKPTAGALGDFNFPTAQEGRAIPYVLGTCKIGGGNTVWWGDLIVSAIKVRPSIFSFSSTITGYKYYIGVQYALCWGGPELVLVGIQANKKALPYSYVVVNNGNGTEDRLVLTVTGQYIFGGLAPGGEGGVTGKMDFYRGLTTQQPNDYLSKKQGRVTLDQSTGLGYTYSGTGNGTMGFLSGGSASLNETITVTATGRVSDITSTFWNKEAFSVDGSVSGHIGSAFADFGFTSTRVNFTIATGSIPFLAGDKFAIPILHSHIAPAYPRLCYAVMEQMYVGTTAYPKPFEFIVRRCPDPFGQGPSVANINGDGNGVLGIYELMTDSLFGLGIVPTKFDVTSFKNAAATVAAEGLGISFQQDSFDSADSIIGEILRHLDGVIYTDPASGLWTIKLARADYDPAAIPLLDASAVESIDYARGSWAETTNHLIVTYLSRASDFNTRTVQAYDPANISITREVRSESIDFKFIGDRNTASLVTMRALKTLTYPIGKLKIVANRKAWNYRMGGVFKVNWTPLGIVGMIFRITHIGYGEVKDGKITIDAVEDIFGINNVAFVSPGESGWVNPVGVPLPNEYEQVVEMPLMIAQSDAVSGVAAAMCMAARNPAVTTTAYQVWIDDGTGIFFNTGTLVPFCPVGVLAADYLAMTPAIDPAGFTLEADGGVDLVLLGSVSPSGALQGLNLLMIDDEIMSWQTVTANLDGTYTISGVIRGVLDTVPKDHFADALVWFFSEGQGPANSANLLADATVRIKMLPTNAAGTLPIAAATAESVTTNSRMIRPYPPGNLRMQGLPYGVRRKTITGDLVLTFSARANTGLPLQTQDQGDATSLPLGYSYIVEVWGNGAIVTPPAVVALGGNFVYAARDRVGGFAPGDGPVTVKVYSYILPTRSWMPNQLTVIMTGFGMTFGKYFGGLNS